jgi:hypothetical protein
VRKETSYQVLNSPIVKVADPILASILRVESVSLLTLLGTAHCLPIVEEVCRRPEAALTFLTWCRKGYTIYSELGVLAVCVFVAIVADVPFIGNCYERYRTTVGTDKAAESGVDVLAPNGYGVVTMTVVKAYGDSGGCSRETENVEELHCE